MSLSDMFPMISMWIIIGLALSAVAVSILGAAFSIIGLGALFSGAVLAVWAMAASLEFAKFVLAAYVHQRWQHINLIFKTYIVFAIVTLSLITSMGVFGFLSDAYQSASSQLDTESIKLNTLQAQQNQNNAEIARITKSIEEIPENRISRRLKARSEAEPLIQDYSKRNEKLVSQISLAQLNIVEIKKRVGPLIYISKAFGIDIDTTVKYLILVFVAVFDPLAICLVIAFTHSLESRKQQPKFQNENAQNNQTASDDLNMGQESSVIHMRFASAPIPPDNLQPAKMADE